MHFRISTNDLDTVDELIELEDLREELQALERELEDQLGPDWRVIFTVAIRPNTRRSARPDD